MSELYRVREFAELTGVTVKALHHDDRVGLPLRQVKALLNQCSPSLVDALTRQRRALDEQRKTLDRAVAAIDWELHEAERLKRSAGVRRAPDRFNEARVSLYRDIAAAIEAGAAADVNGTCAQELIARWRAIVDDEMSGAGEAVKAKIGEMFAHRKTWSPSFKRYVASLYRLEPAVWDRVAEFIDRGKQSPVSSHQSGD